MTSLPAIIRAEVERLGLSQRDLAARCGLTQQQMSLLMRGERSPSAETLRKVLRGLGRPWAWLDRQGLDPRD